MNWVWWLFLIVGAASVGVGVLVAGLDRLTHRFRHSRDGQVVAAPVKHTEVQRADLWADIRRSPEQIGAERMAYYDTTVLDGVERTVHQGLDRIWAGVREWAGMDELDEEWALLSTGELVNT